jgi:hypothetical protein
MTYEELERFAFAMQSRFGDVKTNMFSTAFPIDEQVVSERVAAIDDLLERLILIVDYIQNAPEDDIDTFSS